MSVLLLKNLSFNEKLFNKVWIERKKLMKMEKYGMRGSLHLFTLEKVLINLNYFDNNLMQSSTMEFALKSDLYDKAIRTVFISQ